MSDELDLLANEKAKGKAIRRFIFVDSLKEYDSPVGVEGEEDDGELLYNEEVEEVGLKAEEK